MRDQALLRALVVVRRDDEHGIRTDAFRVLREFDGVGRLVRARAGDDRDAALDRVDSALDGRSVLLVRHRGRLTARARDDDGIRTALDLVLDDAAEFFEVDTILRERRDDGDTCTFENCLLHPESLPYSCPAMPPAAAGHRLIL